MVMKKLGILVPRKGLPSRSPVKPLLPYTTDVPVEFPEMPVIRRATVVLVVATELRIEDCTLDIHGVVPVLLAPLGYFSQATPETLSHRLDVDREPSPPAFGTNVRKAEEVEGRGLCLPPPL